MTPNAMCCGTDPNLGVRVTYSVQAQEVRILGNNHAALTQREGRVLLVCSP